MSPGYSRLCTATPKESSKGHVSPRNTKLQQQTSSPTHVTHAQIPKGLFVSFNFSGKLLRCLLLSEHTLRLGQLLQPIGSAPQFRCCNNAASEQGSWVFLWSFTHSSWTKELHLYSLVIGNYRRGVPLSKDTQEHWIVTPTSWKDIPCKSDKDRQGQTTINRGGVKPLLVTRYVKKRRFSA